MFKSVFRTLFPFALTASAVLQATHPNIVLAWVDDMGYSDIGCFGGEIETPHIDSLADAFGNLSTGNPATDYGFDRFFGFRAGATDSFMVTQNALNANTFPWGPNSNSTFNTGYGWGALQNDIELRQQHRRHAQRVTGRRRPAIQRQHRRPNSRSVGSFAGCGT